MAKIPSWVYDAQALRDAYIRSLMVQGAVLQPTRTIRDSFHTAPGWRDLGMEYTCIPDAAYPPDPAVVRAIKNTWPDLVPVWVRFVFLSPSDTGNPQPKVFGRHAIGRHIKNPHSALPEYHMLMPAGDTLRPHIIEKIWGDYEYGPDGKPVSDLPGPYEPFDWRVYHYIKDTYGEKTEGQIRADRQAKKDAVLDQRAKARVEKARELAEVHKFVQKKLDNISEIEARDYLLGRYYK